MTKILFVCSGNVFRSMAAEKILKKYIKKRGIKDIYVDSAGTDTFNQDIPIEARERLNYYGIRVNHKYKQITNKLVSKSDIIIAMNKDHQDYIMKKYGVKAPLFNEIVINKKTGVLDFSETNEVDDTQESYTRYGYKVVDHIYKSTPKLVKNLKKFLKKHNTYNSNN